MRKFIYDSWEGVMNHERNPLRHIPDLQVRHMTMQVLAFIWSAVFALYIADSIFVFGISAFAHLFFIMAIVITVGTFKYAEKYKWGYHSYGRSREYVMYRDKHGNAYKVKLPDNDPGGEHE